MSSTLLSALERLRVQYAILEDGDASPLQKEKARGVISYIKDINNLGDTIHSYGDVMDRIQQEKEETGATDFDVDTYAIKTQYINDLKTIADHYARLKEIFEVPNRSKERNFLTGKIVEISRRLPRIDPSRPNPIPVPFETVLQTLEGESGEVFDLGISQAAQEEQRRARPPRPKWSNKEHINLVGFDAAALGRKLVGKTVLVRTVSGEKFRAYVAEVTISGVRVERETDTKSFVVHPSRVTVVGEGVGGLERGGGGDGVITTDTVDPLHFDYGGRLGPTTADEGAGFVPLVKEGDEEVGGLPVLKTLERAVQDIYGILRQRERGISFPFTSFVVTAIESDFHNVVNALNIDFVYSPNLYRALVSGFVILYFEERVLPHIQVAKHLSEEGFVQDVSKHLDDGRHIYTSAEKLVSKFTSMLQSEYGVKYPREKRHDEVRGGIKRPSTFVKFSRQARRPPPSSPYHQPSSSFADVDDYRVPTREEAAAMGRDKKTERRFQDRTTEYTPLQSYARLKDLPPPGTHFQTGADGPRIVSIPTVGRLPPGEGVPAGGARAPSTYIEDEEKELARLEEAEEGLIQRLKDMQESETHARIRELIKLDASTPTEKIDARLSEIKLDLLRFSREYERKAAENKRKRRHLLPQQGETDEEKEMSDPKFIKARRTALEKEKATLEKARTAALKKPMFRTDAKLTAKIDALNAKKAEAETITEKHAIEQQIESLKSTEVRTLAEDEILALSRKLVAEFGNPEYKLERLKVLRRRRDARDARDARG
jgi:hypothetical protein